MNDRFLRTAADPARQGKGGLGVCPHQGRLVLPDRAAPPRPDDALHRWGRCTQKPACDQASAQTPPWSQLRFGLKSPPFRFCCIRARHINKQTLTQCVQVGCFVAQWVVLRPLPAAAQATHVTASTHPTPGWVSRGPAGSAGASGTRPGQQGRSQNPRLSLSRATAGCSREPRQRSSNRDLVPLSRTQGAGSLLPGGVQTPL